MAAEEAKFERLLQQRDSLLELEAQRLQSHRPSAAQVERELLEAEISTRVIQGSFAGLLALIGI